MSRILVVDDEKAIRVTLGEFLRRDGYEVDTAEDARKAESLLGEKEFDAVLTDIILPGINGVALLGKIKAASPQTQVVMMTGNPSVETAAAALRNGATDYLSKPCTRETVLHAVSNACTIKTLKDEKTKLEQSNRLYQKHLEQLVSERTTSLEEREKRLENIIDGSIQAIASAVEIRDPYTAGHEQRVAHLAAAIARQLGLDDQKVHGIEIAGFLHDLGKIAVPAEILSKPCRLNDLEFGLIKMHPQVGYEILHKIYFLWPVAEATLQHHERMDGSGYPNGLKGNDIILEARILAVADVVEAMSSHRPYRPAVGVEAALKEIAEHRGTLYDGEIIDACCHLVRNKGFRFE